MIVAMVLRQQFRGDPVEHREPDADRYVRSSALVTLRTLDQTCAIASLDDRWTVGALHGPTPACTDYEVFKVIPRPPVSWDEFDPFPSGVCLPGVRSAIAGDHPHGSGVVLRKELRGLSIRELHADADRH